MILAYILALHVLCLIEVSDAKDCTNGKEHTTVSREINNNFHNLTEVQLFITMCSLFRLSIKSQERLY
ncbi:hypothetical protein BpHYR1_010939 [Brachionus plicatilis]|uniref:Uncharacterized protein n=1 Tax=Brachionus plicatilis TaxID=10195 RepID=A0A3M7P6N7_BRAPC|nr:hypothetical protein BpHYR1_010939 [Brachionus plicatilis]